MATLPRQAWYPAVRERQIATGDRVVDTPPTCRKISGLSQPLNVLNVPDAYLKLSTVVAVTGLSESTIRRRMLDRSFPLPVRLSPRCTRWVAANVCEWLRAQKSAD